MGNYLYLPQQSEEHFEAHNKNDLNFIELNFLPSCLICFPIEKQSSRQFQDFWNWFLNKHSAEIYIAYTTYYFNQAYFEDNFKEKNNSINQLLYFTTFEQQPPDSEYLNHQIYIWIAKKKAIKLLLFLTPFQVNQNIPHKQNNTPLPLFRGNVQDPIKWLDDFERAATANQYNNEYKFQIVGGYLQGSSATWFLQKTNANA
ncbi:hypothetical protein G9A89_004487 [Geosiphon pyriformis]|nr:hypothetical protein G9A89_004487 [Geosiphon pyriformis]